MMGYQVLKGEIDGDMASINLWAASESSTLLGWAKLSWAGNDSKINRAISDKEEGA